MAMNEKLVVPLAGTVIQANNGTALENIWSERLGRVATAVYFTVDLGSAVSVDTIALLATNAKVGTDWAAYAFDSRTDAINSTVGNAKFSTGGKAWASAEAGKRLHRQVLAMFEPVVARYWVIALSEPTQIGRLVIGQSFTAADTMDIGYSFKVVDLGERRRATNSLVNNTLRGKVLEYSWVWSWMSEPEARGALLDLLAYAGTTRDILCILNPDAADLHNVIGYGSLVEEVEGVNVAGGNVDSAYEAKFRLQSRLLLNL